MKAEEKQIWDRFLDFEKENHLFDLQDEYGTYYWDIFRYEIYPLLLWEGGFLPSSEKKRTVKEVIIKAFSMFYEPFRLFFICPKKENLFYLTSRNRVNGKFIDQNAKAVYDLFSEQDSLVIESFNSYNHLKNSFFLPQRIFRRLLKKEKTTDFSFLMNILEKEFGKLSFNEAFLQKKISDYYVDLFFFSKLFYKKKIRSIFLTQNGIQKGIIKAANNLNIPIFEFQHGVVDIGHLAYNYPKINYKEGQVILPHTILSLSPFWFKELYLPNVEIIPIGNDYFYNPLAEIASTTDSSVAQSILVISSDVFGKDLSDFILELEKEGQLKEVPIYFKLHPNQFFEKEYYIEKLSSIKNIRIITNEQSVGELLKICNTVFAIQSTAVYEALQANRKVILLKKMSYLRHKHIFDRKNLHLVDTVQDFISALNTEIEIDPNVAFFTPFDKESFFEAL
jgi:hypothetical protein